MINDPHPTNFQISKMLGEIADLLQQQNADNFRILAYQKAAQLIQKTNDDLSAIAIKGNAKALEALPGIGESIARLIIEYVKTGRSKLLLKLQGAVNAEDLFEELPGIGEELAERIVKELDIHSLEELELAAHDGRLDNIEGFGEQRVEAIQLMLAGMLSNNPQRKMAKSIGKENVKIEQPAIELLLNIDQDYRKKAAMGTLKRIAPRRFNPDGVAWLPIMHMEKEGWSFTALFSNTLRAHELEKTSDWVILYYEKEKANGQSTIVTETSGPLKGERVARGREIECQAFYAEPKTKDSKSMWQLD